MCFRKVVGITSSSYVRFRIILTALFNGTLVNNEVTTKVINLYASLKSSGRMVFISLAASKESSTEYLFIASELSSDDKYFQYHSEEYLLCQLWAEGLVYLDNLYGFFVNRESTDVYPKLV